ncbi:MAG TPA: hypothetical protein VF139_15240 [Candidatus Polarisedimenticolaceae bacterium]
MVRVDRKTPPAAGRGAFAVAAAFAAATVLFSADPDADARKAVVTGEVVDSACYVKSGSKGESHRECAQRCADAGIPLAILEDGTGRVVWVASIADMETPNARLRPHAGRRVRVEGTWAERGGARLLLVASVTPVAR